MLFIYFFAISTIPNVNCSTTNRKASDLKQAEAQEILKQLEALEQKE